MGVSKADRPDHPRAAERFNEEQATYAVRGDGLAWMCDQVFVGGFEK